MHRLGILSIYDKDGIIDASLRWYIQELYNFVDTLIIVSNGDVKENEYQWLQEHCHRFVVRENKGYDAGAYKEVLESDCHLGEYDEVILSNDTFFGPFIPLGRIFEEVDDKPYDFWGLNRRHIPLYDFITSFFLVFRHKTIPAVVDYFHEAISDDLSRDDVLILFEQGISNELKRKGFRMGSYSDIVAVDIYREPDYLIKILKSPVMKKRCFEEGYYVKDNCRRALKYIKENLNYDISLIEDTVSHKYGLILGEDYVKLEETDKDYERIFYYGASQKELELYLKSNPEVYLYGMGITASDFRKQYEDKVTVRGYIVSNTFYRDELKGKKNVIALGEVKDMTLPIVVTLSKENSREVAPMLQRFHNVFFLWRWKP